MWANVEGYGLLTHSPYAKHRMMLWDGKRGQTTFAIPVKTGIQTKGLPDLGSCFRRNDDKNELRSCA